MRTWLESLLAGQGLIDAVRSDAVLVASELTGNAVRHAGTDFTVSVSLLDGTLRLEVFDHDTRPPTLLRLDDESTSGRGLHIVAAIADDWGWNAATGDGVSGKVVWAELAVDGLDEAAASGSA